VVLVVFARTSPLRAFATGKLSMRPFAKLKSSVAGASAPSSDLKSKFTAASSTFVNLFPVWTVIAAGAGLLNPSIFAWLTTEYFTAGLALLMVSMGITLTPQDFKDVLANPESVGVQFAECYLMMPFLALALGRAFNLPKDIIAGLVLVGSINGGQASNLCTYIAKGNVALSVVMTTATTIGAIFFTPIMCKVLLGAVVPVNALGIAMSTIQVVLAPILVGMTAKKFAPKQVDAVLPVAPILGVLSTVFLVGSAVSQVSSEILQAGWMLQVCVALLHFAGGIAGYAAPKLMGYGETTCRTMAIETAMKSSAFGFLLAKLHFAAKLTRVPSAVSVVWMAVTGSTLAVIWKYIPVNEAADKAAGKK